MSGKELNELIQTGELAKGEIRAEQLKAAEEYAEEQLEEAKENAKEDRDRRRIALIKFGSMAVLAAAIVIFASIAWFTMNRETSSNGMSVTTTTLPFEIATKGSNIRYQDIITSKTEYIDGDPITIDEESYYKTGTTDSILLRFNAGDSEIGPGGNGFLNLYVIPKLDTEMDVKVTLNVVAYAELDKYEEATDPETGDTVYVPVYKKDDNEEYILDDENNKIVETEIVEITTASEFTTKATAIHNSEAVSNVNDYISAAKYLQGHIMFFGEAGDTSNSTAEAGRYYYKTPYTTRTINKHIEGDNKDKAIQIPIYWMWPNTLGQIALPDNVSDERSGYPILADSNTTGKALVTTYLNTYGDSIFDNYNASTTPGYITDVTTVIANASQFNTTAFDDLSKGYNDADHLIGTRIAYFLIEVKVDPAD